MSPTGDRTQVLGHLAEETQSVKYGIVTSGLVARSMTGQAWYPVTL